MLYAQRRISSDEKRSIRVVMYRQKRAEESEGKETWGDGDEVSKKEVMMAMMRG